MPKLWKWVERIDAADSLWKKYAIEWLGGAGVVALIQGVLSALRQPSLPWWGYLCIAGLCAIGIGLIISHDTEGDKADEQIRRVPLPTGESVDPDQLRAIRPQIQSLSGFERLALRELLIHEGLSNNQFLDLMKLRGYPIVDDSGRPLDRVANACQDIFNKTTILDRTYSTGSWFVKNDLKPVVRRLLSELSNAATDLAV